jgi:hypothetical protein
MEPERVATGVPIALAKWSEASFRGQTHWFGALWALVGELMAEQAAWRPEPERHSIWEIVRHVTFWRRYVLDDVLGRPKPDIRSGSWSPPDQTDEERWQADLEELRLVQEEFVTWLRSQPAESLLAPNTKSEYGLFWYALGLLNHDSYHAGQIAYLRALMGLPAVD